MNTTAEVSTYNGLNLYAYCNNSPIAEIDPSGNWSLKKAWRKATRAIKKTAKKIAKEAKELGGYIEDACVTVGKEAAEMAKDAGKAFVEFIDTAKVYVDCAIESFYCNVGAGTGIGFSRNQVFGGHFEFGFNIPNLLDC